jgi:hypothetical protein
MPGTQLLIESFQYGLDTRRSELTSKTGALVQAVNCHINQGAQVEKRKLFGRLALPAGTFGIDGTLNGLVVYGSGATPAGLAAWPAFNTSWIAGNAVPLSYLRLQAPAAFDTSAMTGVVWSTLFGGLPFVISSFASGNVYVFQATATGYTVVIDFYAGLVLSGYASNPDQAAQLTALVNGLTNYTAVQGVGGAANTVTITGVDGAAYTATSTEASALGVINQLQTNVGTPAVNASQPSAQFTIIAGAFGTGTAPYMNQIAIQGGGSALLTNVPWTGDPVSFARAVGAAVNAGFASNGGFSALSNGATVTVYAPAGTADNGLSINPACQPSSNHDGQILLTACVFTFNVPTGGGDTVTNIASATDGNLDTTSRALSAFASVNAWLTQIATDLTTTSYATNWGAVAIGSQLYVGLNYSQSPGFGGLTDTITITHTPSGGTTIGSSQTLSAVANPATVNGAGSLVTVQVSGGTPPYTYSWTITNASIFMSTQNAATNSFNTSVQSSPNKSGYQPYLTGTATCVVTDSNGSIVKVLVNVTVQTLPITF